MNVYCLIFCLFVFMQDGGASTPVSSHSISVVDLSSVHGGGNTGGPDTQEVMQAMSAFSYDGELIPLPQPVVLAEGSYLKNFARTLII